MLFFGTMFVGPAIIFPMILMTDTRVLGEFALSFPNISRVSSLLLIFAQALIGNALACWTALALDGNIALLGSIASIRDAILLLKSTATTDLIMTMALTVGFRKVLGLSN